MGSSGQRDTTTTNTSGSGQQVLPQLSPFVTGMGQRATQALYDPNLQLGNFTSGAYMNVPGLSPMEQLSGQQIADRALYGIPQPGAEQTAQFMAQNLPTAAGRQVPLSQYNTQGLGTIQQMSQQAQQPNPYQTQGLQGLSNFAGGDLGNSAAIQAALEGLQQEIVPVVQNQAAMAGVANSGFLPNQIARAYARELVPLYMQGMGQQLSANQSLFQGGSQLQNTALQGLGTYGAAQMGLGQQEQGLGTEALNRGTQAAQGVLNPLLTIGQRQEARPRQATQDAMMFGDLQRQIQTAQNQSQFDAYLRNRDVALGLLNPFGGIPSSTSQPTSSNTTRRISGGGDWGLSK